MDWWYAAGGGVCMILLRYPAIAVPVNSWVWLHYLSPHLFLYFSPPSAWACWEILFLLQRSPFWKKNNNLSCQPDEGSEGKKRARTCTTLDKTRECTRDWSLKEFALSCHKQHKGTNTYTHSRNGLVCTHTYTPYKLWCQSKTSWDASAL